jgi:hypothetical protein
VFLAGATLLGVVMSHENEGLVQLLLGRLLAQYGPLLTNADVAVELRIARDALYNRRSRGKTGGMPDPVPGLFPQQFRAVDLARWFAGVPLTSTQPAPIQVRRGPGRPRKQAADEVRRELGGR